MENRLILHVIDWNGQDRYYEVPEEILAQFKDRIEANQAIETPWDWFINEHVDFGDEPDLPVIYGGNQLRRIDMTLPQVTLDFNDAVASVKTWELP